MAELIGADKVLDMLKALPERTRIASSRAINVTLRDVQKLTGEKLLPDKFTLRGNGKQWWQPGQRMGFNVRPFSNPQTLEGRLGSQADWLGLQEKGGTKSAGEHRVAIPEPGYKPEADIMRREIKPRAILADRDAAARKLSDAESALSAHRRSGQRMSKAEKQRRHDLKLQVRAARREFRTADQAFKARQGMGQNVGSKAFVATMASGFTGIFKRLTNKRRPLKLLFSLDKYAHIDPKLNWELDAGDAANAIYDEKFRIEFARLLR